MPVPKLDELLALDVETKLSLVTALWNSIVEHQEELPLSEEQKIIIDKWTAEDDATPEASVPWEVAREEILRE